MNDELLERLLDSPRLPSLPAIALEVIDLAQQPDVEFREIAEAIQHDPALTSKILKTVNSTFYGQPREISTISRALQVLGLNSVKTLTLGFSLVGNLKGSAGKGFDHVAFWRRSLYTATAARQLSRHARLVQQEETFLGGLLQDLGMVVMSQILGDEYAPMLERAGSCHASLRAAETDTFGLNHAEVGGALADRWKLPPLLVSLIRYHEEPEAAERDLLPLTRSVALGNRVAEIFLTDQGDPVALDTFHTQSGAWFSIDREQAETLLRQIHRQTQDLSRLFDVPTGNLGNPDEILSRANEALMQLTLQSQLENQALASQVRTDALTGVSNRRAFDESVKTAYDAVADDRPLSVLFTDVDHFKRFNDAHGHALGDRVLKVFAQVMSAAVGDEGEVFRYGGEEFAVVCPGANRTAAVAIAERIRRAVEERARVRNGSGEELPITCSVGVASHVDQRFDTVHALVKAADEAVYAAKAAGRNCVRADDSRHRSDAA